MERTMTIIDRCVDTYLEAYRNGHVPSAGTMIRTPPESPSNLPVSPGKLSPASPGFRTIADRMKDLPTTPPEDGVFAQAFTLDGESSPNKPPPRTGTRRPSQPLDSQPSQSRPAQIPRKPVNAAATELPARPTRKPPPTPMNVTGQPASMSHTSNGPDGPAASSADATRNANGNGRTQPMLPPTRIFKPLEDYINRSYGDQESLNISFLTPRSRPRVASRADETKRTRPNPSSPKQGGLLAPENAISDIDPKTLMLGDVATNGLWWTGIDERPSGLGRRRKSDRGPDREQDRTLEAPKGLVSLRNPHLHWFELDTWYQTISTAGTNWRNRLKSDSEDNISPENVERDLGEGRAHLHQTLLRCTESLLKRPGRPLKDPDDLRFLLIILANPLIYPPSAKSTSDGTAKISNQWEAGNAYGIIKRVLGLISNLQNDCHRHLTTWFSRYDEPRFRNIIELIERFVTHRLKRSRTRKKSSHVNPTAGLIPNLSGTNADTSAQLHAALGLSNQNKSNTDKSDRLTAYSEDWQIKAAARVMSILFTSNKNFNGERSASTLAEDARMSRPGSISRTHIKIRGQLLSTSDFYNTMVDISDLIADFDIWESSKGSRFAFCQYPFFLSVGAKIRIMEHDAKRQMEARAREAFFDSLLKNKALEQNLLLKVRRDCLVEDSLNGISEVVGTGQEDIKKSLKVQFVNEEGIDAGGLRKEWFLLLAREIFDPNFGRFFVKSCLSWLMQRRPFSIR